MKRRLAQVFFLLALVGLVVVARLVVGPSFEPVTLLERLRAIGSQGWTFWAFCGLYLVASSALLPAAVLHVVAGAMWGFWGALGPVYLLANVSGHLHFAAGRWLGRERMRDLLIRRGWTAAMDELERSGVLAVLVLRQTPIPFMATNLVCGASPITWPQFLVGHAIGLLPGVLISTWFSSAIASGVSGAKEQAVQQLAIAGVGVFLFAVISRLVMAQVRKARQRTTPT